MTGASRERGPRAAPLDRAALEARALAYVARYATSRAKLARYLGRIAKERGWAGEGVPPIDAIVARLVDLRFVDDRGFAEARGRALTARGYGRRRIAATLDAAGIGREEQTPALAAAEENGWTAALAYARRRRIGPFATSLADTDGRRRAFAALLRAGHAMAHARALSAAAPGEVPEEP